MGRLIMIGVMERSSFFVSFQYNDTKPSRSKRTVWTGEIERLFQNAVQRLGPHAHPKEILLEMNSTTISRSQVSSHLQTLRRSLKDNKISSNHPILQASFSCGALRSDEFYHAKELNRQHQ